MAARSSNKLRPNELHWLGEPVIAHQGTCDQVAGAIPSFGRRPFGLYTREVPSDELRFVTGENPYYDEVVRLGLDAEPDIPIGIVSKSYQLVQHRDIFAMTVRALKQADIDPGLVTVSLTLSRFGGRMALRFLLPEDLGFDPGDSHPLRLRLECLNSVEGSTRLVFLMSWMRLVCGNGLVARVIGVHEAMIHSERAQLPDVTSLIQGAMQSLSSEKQFYDLAMRSQVDRSRLQDWVDGPLTKKWGVLAAARAYLICETGSDGVFLHPFEKQVASRKEMKKTEQVPGAGEKAQNLYAVAQALSWIAGKRSDVQDQTQFMREIPGLMSCFAPVWKPADSLGPK